MSWAETTAGLVHVLENSWKVLLGAWFALSACLMVHVPMLENYHDWLQLGWIVTGSFLMVHVVSAAAAWARNAREKHTAHRTEVERFKSCSDVEKGFIIQFILNKVRCLDFPRDALAVYSLEARGYIHCRTAREIQGVYTGLFEIDEKLWDLLQDRPTYTEAFSSPDSPAK